MNRGFCLGRLLIGLMIIALVGSFFQFDSQPATDIIVLSVNCLTPLQSIYLHL